LISTLISNLDPSKHRFTFTFLGIFILLSPSFGQGEKDPIFPVNDIYFKKWGWYAGIGGNYTVPLFNDVVRTYQNSDSVSTVQFTGVGQPGMMIEGGAFYLLDNPVVSYLEGGLRFNWFRAKEDISTTVVNASDNNTLLQQEDERSFDQVNVSLRLDANNTIKVSKYGFIQNTLGLNFDYLFYSEYQSSNPLYSEATDDVFQAQIHYKLSYGFRLDLMHYMIIGIDAPILTIAPWNDGRQTIDVFESYYWPLTLSVRILFMQKSNRPDCKKPPPLDMNKKRKEAKMF